MSQKIYELINVLFLHIFVVYVSLLLFVGTPLLLLEFQLYLEPKYKNKICASRDIICYLCDNNLIVKLYLLSYDIIVLLYLIYGAYKIEYMPRKRNICVLGTLNILLCFLNFNKIINIIHHTISVFTLCILSYMFIKKYKTNIQHDIV
jgi:hypothetical protein